MFTERSGLPEVVVGALDGSLIPVYVEQDCQGPHWSRKTTLAINVMYLGSCDGLIYAIESKNPGSDHDSLVFQESELYQVLAVQKRLPFDGAKVLGDQAYKVCISDEFYIGV